MASLGEGERPSLKAAEVFMCRLYDSKDATCADAVRGENWNSLKTDLEKNIMTTAEAAEHTLRASTQVELWQLCVSRPHGDLPEPRGFE